MKKMTLTDKYLETLIPIAFNENSRIYKTKEGEYVKLFMPFTLQLYYIGAHVDLEAKLLNKEKYYISTEIKKPNTVIYARNGMAVGYKMEPAIGIDFNKFDTTLSAKESINLTRFNDIHKRLEDIVKKNKNIVFPDLCTCDNIYIGPKDSIELIDYDGMQIGKYQAIAMSTTLGNQEHYYIPKYWQNNLFTKNLDKKSLILLYFLSTFQVDLNKVGVISPFTRQPITLEEFFWLMGLNDNEIFDKVSKIFKDDENNVYLEDSIDKIAKDYKMIIEKVGPVSYMKKLKRK